MSHFILIFCLAILFGVDLKEEKVVTVTTMMTMTTMNKKIKAKLRM